MLADGAGAEAGGAAGAGEVAAGEVWRAGTYMMRRTSWESRRLTYS